MVSTLMVKRLEHLFHKKESLPKIFPEMEEEAETTHLESHQAKDMIKDMIGKIGETTEKEATVELVEDRVEARTLIFD